MDIKSEPFELLHEIIDIPDFDLEKIKIENIQENIDIKVEPVELKCEDCEEKFINELALKIHEMFHSKTNYCFVCKRTVRINFHDHIERRHMNLVCGICSKVFTLKRYLDNHIRSHTKDRIFKCDKCDKSFMQKGALTSHLTSAHEGIKPYICQICEGTFTTASSLKKHVRIMHSGNEIRECRICGEKFNDKKRKMDHEKKHTQSNKCELCGKIFAKSDNLSRHLVSTHFRTEKCKYCNKMYHKLLLGPHIVEKHQPRVCDVCDTTFYDVRSFKYHRVTHDTKIMCILCGKYYKEDNMNKHLQCHRENKVKKCEICNYVYLDIDKHNLRIHRNTKYCFCHLCPKKFLTKWSRTQHMFKEHLKALGNNVCKFCGIKCKGSATLRQHLNLHYHLRPYKCLMCRTGFKYLHWLENHKKQHDNLRVAKNDYKFNCTICGRRFKFEISLKHHKCTIRKYKCNICDLPYRDKRYLRKHLITYHSPTILTAANTRDLDKSTLKNMNISRDSTIKYRCKKCRMIFTQWYSFKKHFCTMQRAAGYTCSLCHKKYRTKKDVAQHIVENHPKKKVKCNECEFLSVNKISMRRHYVRIHAMREINNVNGVFENDSEHDVLENGTKVIIKDSETKNMDTCLISIKEEP